jgi:hypothetical protein
VDKNNPFPTIAFAGLFILPSLAMVSLGQSSMAFGLLAYIGCLVAYDLADRLLFRPNEPPTPISAKVSWRAAVLLIFIAGHSGWLF